MLKLGGYVNFFRTFSENVTRTNSETFLQGASSTWNNLLSQGENLNWRLSTSFRMEWMPDSMTNIIFRPSFSHSQSRGTSGSNSVIFTFNRAIIDATAPYCVAYKPNLAFYECFGTEGWNALECTVRYIRDKDSAPTAETFFSPTMPHS